MPPYFSASQRIDYRLVPSLPRVDSSSGLVRLNAKSCETFVRAQKTQFSLLSTFDTACSRCTSERSAGNDTKARMDSRGFGKWIQEVGQEMSRKGGQTRGKDHQRKRVG